MKLSDSLDVQLVQHIKSAPGVCGATSLYSGKREFPLTLSIIVQDFRMYAMPLLVGDGRCNVAIADDGVDQLRFCFAPDRDEIQFDNRKSIS